MNKDDEADINTCKMVTRHTEGKTGMKEESSNKLLSISPLNNPSSQLASFLYRILCFPRLTTFSVDAAFLTLSTYRVHARSFHASST